jgi:hypothetical protein
LDGSKQTASQFGLLFVNAARLCLVENWGLLSLSLKYLDLGRVRDISTVWLMQNFISMAKTKVAAHHLLGSRRPARPRMQIIVIYIGAQR